MTKILKAIESHYTGEQIAIPGPPYTEFRCETERYDTEPAASMSRAYIHKAQLRLHMNYAYAQEHPPQELPKLILNGFAKALYGDIREDLIDTFHLIHELKMRCPGEEAMALQYKIEAIIHKLYGG